MPDTWSSGTQEHLQIISNALQLCSVLFVVLGVPVKVLAAGGRWGGCCEKRPWTVSCWAQLVPDSSTTDPLQPMAEPIATCVAPLWKNKKWKGKMTHKQRSKGKECEEQQCEHQGERIITGRRCFRCWSRDCPAVCRGNHSQTVKKMWGGRSNQEELLWSGPSSLYLPVTTPFLVGRSLEWRSKNEPMRRWRRGLLLMSVLLFTITYLTIIFYFLLAIN